MTCPGERARTHARTLALKHALMHSHAAPTCAGYSSLAAQRAGLEKQLAEPDLDQAERASLEKEFGAVQTKMAKGGKALPWFGLGRLLSQLPAHQPFDRAAPSGCVEPECGSSAGRLG